MIMYVFNIFPWLCMCTKYFHDYVFVQNISMTIYGIQNIPMIMFVYKIFPWLCICRNYFYDWVCVQNISMTMYVYKIFPKLCMCNKLWNDLFGQLVTLYSKMFIFSINYQNSLIMINCTIIIIIYHHHC